MNTIKIFFIFIILFNLNKIAYSNIIEIKVKIQNQIITNIDIENERKYLLFLNPKLNELENSKINNIAKESLINEIIKKTELKKFFDFSIKNNVINSVINRLLKRKNIKDKDEFLQILSSQNLDFEDIKEKLYIEALWNQLIYEKYSDNVIINKEDLRKNILDQVEKIGKKFSYNLSEIVFNVEINESLEEKVSKINDSIKEIGFENSANIYSVANTSNNGGLIGWVNEIQISKEIGIELKKLNISEITKPLKLQNSYILIKLNDKKEFKQEINVDDQLNRLVNRETNRQLNNFSTIYYKRLKKNIDINEY
jgi:peptidyl-prolyl cis-trans isomerase SurA